jgi:hypothetical protein
LIDVSLVLALPRKLYSWEYLDKNLNKWEKFYELIEI